VLRAVIRVTVARMTDRIAKANACGPSWEPGTNEEIKKFCHNRYNVSFPMMGKVSVVGADKTPLYVFLTDKTVNPQIGGEIKWNFTKFLFDRNGKPVERFEPAVTPDSPQVTAAIEAALDSKK